MLKEHYNTVYCDLDGTLIDDKMRHYKCYENIVKKYGGKAVSIEEYWNDKRNKVNRHILLEKTHFKGSYEQYLQEWNLTIENDEFMQYAVLKDGVYEALKWMHSISDKVCLVTMRQNGNMLEKQLKVLSIYDEFDEICKAMPYQDKKSKVVRITAGESNLVIGDTEDDGEFAKEIKADFLALSSGLREEKYLTSANLIIDSWPLFLLQDIS